MKSILVAGLAGLLLTAPALAADLTLTPYNPGPDGMFPVTSTLVEGPTEVLLVDAQFERDDAQVLLDRIRATGKPLTTIYISAGDPDFYFGLDVITEAYPDAKVLATAATAEHISKTAEGKLAYWGPILGANAPTRLIQPEVIATDHLTVDGIPLQITGPDAAHQFLWVPSEQTILGGVALFENQHVWMADTQTKAARQGWQDTLAAMLALNPARVIPGHTLGNSSETPDIIRFTADYIVAFETEAATAAGSAALIAAMQGRYPAFAASAGLEISAKVFTGEMTWPQ